jgi:hypothetical protein
MPDQPVVLASQRRLHHRPVRTQGTFAVALVLVLPSASASGAGGGAAPVPKPTIRAGARGLRRHLRVERRHRAPAGAGRHRVRRSESATRAADRRRVRPSLPGDGARPPRRRGSHSDLLPHLVLRPYPGAAAGDFDAYVSADAFRRFAQDLPRKLTDVLAASQRPGAFQPLVTEAGPPAGADVPSWYVVAGSDNLIPPAAQRVTADCAGATTTEVDSSHVAMMSHPKRVTGVITDAAVATAASEERTGLRRRPTNPRRTEVPFPVSVLSRCHGASPSASPSSAQPQHLDCRRQTS